MSLKTFLSFVILLLCGLSLYQGGCTIVDLRPKESELENSPIDPISEPIQVNISPDINSSFLKVVDGVKILITPKAYYE